MRSSWLDVLLVGAVCARFAYAVPCSSLVVKRTGLPAAYNYQSYPTEANNCDWLHNEVFIWHDDTPQAEAYVVELLAGAVDWVSTDSRTVYWIYYDSGTGPSIPLRVRNPGGNPVGVSLAFVNNYSAYTDFTDVDVSLGNGNLVGGMVSGNVKYVDVGGDRCALRTAANVVGPITAPAPGITVDGSVTSAGSIVGQTPSVTVSGEMAGTIAGETATVTVSGQLTGIVACDVPKITISGVFDAPGVIAVTSDDLEGDQIRGQKPFEAGQNSWQGDRMTRPRPASAGLDPANVLRPAGSPERRQEDTTDAL